MSTPARTAANRSPSHELYTAPSESSASLRRPEAQITQDTPQQPSRDGTPSARDRSLTASINWPNAFWLIFLHVGALAAFWTFSWEGVVAMLLLHWATGGVGICLGYHRLFTHRSFQRYRPMRWLLATLGGLAGEGPPIDWVANHRKHHALSDKDGDPHSPRDGGWWSHILWVACHAREKRRHARAKRWAPDLTKEPMMRFLDHMFLPSHFLLGGVLFGTGYWLGGALMGWSLLVWGVFVRQVFVMHSTWFVNSASHMWGYRNYPTRDQSRNSWWVALLTYGEGWHNNHHAYPRMANHGHRWWEYDMTFRTIRLMERLGLAWDVVDYKHKRERSAA